MILSGWQKMVAVVVVAGPLLAGCGAAANTSAGHSNASATKPAQLVLYSAQGYDQAEATAFQKATGIKVKLDDMSTGPLLAKVQSEGTHPQWDVIWFDGNEPMASLAQSNMLYTGYSPANLSRYNSLGRSLLPSNHAYFPTGVTAAAAIVYNKKAILKSEVPHTWKALLSSQFKGKIGMNNPAISGPTFPFVAGIFQEFGVAGGEKFFEQLKANGLHIYSTNGDTVQALQSGAIDIGMIQDSAEWKLVQSDPNFGVVYPTSGVAMLPSDMAIAKNAPDLKAAELFVNFVLGPKGQQVMQDETAAGSDSLFDPVIKGESALPARGGNPSKWINVNPVYGGEHQASWTQWFTTNIVGQ
ncbi:ABC transporter substrate-binding protein [Sulfobacillus harzensis]|uniref:Extracellular solute-binding protein n=1 Tax=Sulfobacillus harzensis TaxID=2729629 RepID=A0A7Y0L4P1_9FIRM|nr:extracellular solute-binding protein [Sulfobacillus harzensis]NMP23170.1 extracellular solute-binding protein [Sulfobacillus harzensis]